MDQKNIELAYELVDEIKQTKTYLDYAEALAAIEESAEVQALSKAFKEAETAYNDAKQYGKHHPDLKKRQHSFQMTKKALFEHPLVKTFKASERALQQILDNVASSIATSVSPRIKVNYNTGFPQIGGSSCKVEKA
ncbi:MAG: YlbF family regulator [Bacillota bacterium]